MARELQLENEEPVMPKRRLRGGEIELPHAAEPLVVESDRLVAVGHEALAPRAERPGVVHGEDLQILHQEAGLFGCRQHLGEGGNVAARKNVLFDEGLVQKRRLGASDRVEQHHAVLALQQRRGLCEEGGIAPPADMLEHADRHDPVERPVDAPIVREAKVDAPVEALFLRAALGDRELLLRERDPGDADAGRFAPDRARGRPSRSRCRAHADRARATAWRRCAASSRAARPRDSARAFRNRRRNIGGRRRGRARRVPRRDRNGGRRSAWRPPASPPRRSATAQSDRAPSARRAARAGGGGRSVSASETRS